MSHDPTLDSWICTFGSRVTPSRSLAPSPVTMASLPTPQWYGSPIVCTVRPPMVSGVIRSVTRTRASIAERGEISVAQP